jgi:hypothetical protein
MSIRKGAVMAARRLSMRTGTSLVVRLTEVPAAAVWATRPLAEAPCQIILVAEVHS